MIGYSRGFLKMVYRLLSWLVVLLVVMVLAPFIENSIKSNEGIYNKIVVCCEDIIRDRADSDTEDIALKEKEADEEVAVGENEFLASLLEKLPPELMEDIKLQTEEFAGGVMEKYGIYNMVAVAMADLFIRAASNLVALLVGASLSKFLSIVLKYIMELPLVGFTNKVLGMAGGAANGVLIVWIAFYVVALSCTMEWGSNMIRYIYASKFLTYIYEHNLVLSILTQKFF